MQHIQKTKSRLSYTFFSAILGLIILLGVSFFSFRFIDGYRRDFGETQMLNTQRGFIIENSFGSSLPLDMGRDSRRGHRPPIPFVVIYDQNGVIISKNLAAQYENNDTLESLFHNREVESFQNAEGFGFFYDVSNGGKALIFKPFRYPLLEYLEDIGFFLLFTLIFSIPLYFAIRRFVDKTFLPVEQSHKDMEDFIHNAGHELKTPLAVIDGDLQLLKAKKVYDEASIEEMIGEIRSLDKLIEGLVDLSSISPSSEIQKIDITKELEQIQKFYQNQIDEKMIQVHFDIKYPLIIEANLGYVQIFLSNLFSNAIRYNKQAGTIALKIDEKYLCISDSGIGIDEVHHSKIWQRFYKIDGGKKGGKGIGLSLVKKIAQIYNWKLSMKSKKGEFTSFEVRFP